VPTSSQSTYTLESVYADLLARGDLDPGWDVAGYTVRPILNIANKTFKNLVGGLGMFPWKWNQFNLPQFVCNSWQQDYALIDSTGASVTSLAWLQEGMAVDINNPSEPKPYRYVEVGRNQPRATATYQSNSVYQNPLFVATFLPNNLLYYGTWGAAQAGNSTWGNNPQSGQVVTNPYVSGTPMPSNPILQIKDANANLLVLTGYGTLGTTAPVAPANSLAGVTATAGSGDTTTWKVVDPYGAGIRISPVPSQTGTVWQLNLVGQMKPTNFVGTSSLANQTLFPLTDDYYQYFLDGCAAECLLYSPQVKKRQEYPRAYQVWLASVKQMRQETDREKEENTIRPRRSILSAGGNAGGNPSSLGPNWPQGGPVY